MKKPSFLRLALIVLCAPLALIITSCVEDFASAPAGGTGLYGPGDSAENIPVPSRVSFGLGVSYRSDDTPLLMLTVNGRNVDQIEKIWLSGAGGKFRSTSELAPSYALASAAWTGEPRPDGTQMEVHYYMVSEDAELIVYRAEWDQGENPGPWRPIYDVPEAIYY